MSRPRSTVVLVLLFALLPVSVFAQTPHFWSRSDGSATADFGHAIAANDAGTIAVAGVFQQSLDFGGGPLVSAGSTDAFVVALDRDGQHLWSRAFGSVDSDEALDVAIDDAGRIAITGRFRGSVDFGGGALVSAGSADVFLAVYDESGNHVWSRAFGDAGSDQGLGVDFDPTSGAVAVSGTFSGNVDFGGGLLSALGNDAFLARYAVDGTHVWSRRLGSAGFEVARDVACLRDEITVVVGSFDGNVDFGGGIIVNKGSGDGFAAAYDVDGQHLWSQGLGGPSLDEALSVDVDASGAIAISGYFLGSASFGGTTLTSSGGRDGFVARYDIQGRHQWSRSYGGTLDDFGYAVAIDDALRVSIIASFRGVAAFGAATLVSAGQSDVGVARFGADGAPDFAVSYGGPSGDDGAAIATDGDGNIIGTGGFTNPVDFGGGPLPSAGSVDVFVVKLGAEPAPPTVTSITDVPNDQGRAVRLRFDRSGYDTPSSPVTVLRYDAFRRIEGVGGDQTAWEAVGSVFAYGADDYAMIVPTLVDSTIVDGLVESVFFVRAATSDPFTYFDATPAAGYSVDNLAPSAPQDLALVAGVLDWDASTATDFDYFTVYGSHVDVLDSGAQVVAYTTMTQRDVTNEAFSYYFVTTTDFSGNESAATRAETATAVAPTTPGARMDLRAQPNPFNPRTTLELRLPQAGAVSVTVYDVRGARVRTLHRGALDAGDHAFAWDGTDTRGQRIASGTYFVRAIAPGTSRTVKVSLVE